MGGEARAAGVPKHTGRMVPVARLKTSPRPQRLCEPSLPTALPTVVPARCGLPEHGEDFRSSSRAVGKARRGRGSSRESGGTNSAYWLLPIVTGRPVVPVSGGLPRPGPRLSWSPAVPCGGTRGCARAPSPLRGARARSAAQIAGTRPSAGHRSPVSVRCSSQHSTSCTAPSPYHQVLESLNRVLAVK